MLNYVKHNFYNSSYRKIGDKADLKFNAKELCTLKLLM